MNIRNLDETISHYQIEVNHILQLYLAERIFEHTTVGLVLSEEST